MVKNESFSLITQNIINPAHTVITMALGLIISSLENPQANNRITMEIPMPKNENNINVYSITPRYV